LASLLGLSLAEHGRQREWGAPQPLWMRRQGEYSDGAMSYDFASNQRDALPNASFIGLTPSRPPLGRASPNVAPCLSQSARLPPVTGTPIEHLQLIPAGQEHILERS